MHELLRIRLVRLIEGCIPRDCRDGEEREGIGLPAIHRSLRECLHVVSADHLGRKEGMGQEERMAGDREIQRMPID